jgi:cytoskeletal protein RodZ
MSNENKKFKEFLEEKLKEKGLNLKRLSEISGITLNHLNDLINENLGNLPAAPYVRGYLVKLGKILNFNSEEWWEYFKARKDLKSSGREDEFPKNRFARQAVFKYILIGFIAILILIYLILRFNVIFGKPVVELNIPPSIINVSDQKFILSGKVENADKIFINSEETTIHKNGEFSKEIMLQPGINNIEIKAQKLLGSETKILRQVFYEQKTNLDLNNLENQSTTR